MIKQNNCKFQIAACKLIRSAICNLKFAFCILFPSLAMGQVNFSFATDVSVLRSFDERQSFTVIGQTVHGLVHLDPLHSIYAFVSYHKNGRYSNRLMAFARQSTTQPQAISFRNNSEMRLRQISVGLRRYFLGNFKREEKVNLYGSAGFGLILGKAFNTFSVSVDTSLYAVENNITNGSGRFRRLSFDLSAGFEFNVAYEIFFFSEARMYVPASDYPSNFLVKSNDAPLLGSINLGIRILFNYEE